MISPKSEWNVLLHYPYYPWSNSDILNSNPFRQDAQHCHPRSGCLEGPLECQMEVSTKSHDTADFQSVTVMSNVPKALGPHFICRQQIIRTWWNCVGLILSLCWIMLWDAKSNSLSFGLCHFLSLFITFAREVGCGLQPWSIALDFWICRIQSEAARGLAGSDWVYRSGRRTKYGIMKKNALIKHIGALKHLKNIAG